MRAGNTQTEAMQNSSNSNVTKEIIASKNELKKIQDDIGKNKNVDHKYHKWNLVHSKSTCLATKLC